MTDERQGYPSASSAQRYALCPGSFMLEQQCPLEPESEDAASGSRIHAALAGEPVVLTHEEGEAFEACKRQEETLTGGINSWRCIAREQRLWFHVWHRGRSSQDWSGKPDAVYQSESSDAGLIIDYKTGRGEVSEAIGNMQLRALAVLASGVYGFREVTVAIVQPLAGPPSACVYTQDDLAVARSEIIDLMRRVQQPGQPRNPSEAACKYCRAKAICPEARAVAGDVVYWSQPMAIELMTRQEVADFLNMAPVAEKVIEAVRAKAKQMLESGEKLPGWTLKDGPARATITDPQTVFQRFINSGGTDAQFMRAVKIGKGDLKTALKESTGQTGKALDTALANLLDGCTETKPTAKQLTRIKQ